MSGDNRNVSQALKFYTEEITETKRISKSDFSLKLCIIKVFVLFLMIDGKNETVRFRKRTLNFLLPINFSLFQEGVFTNSLSEARS